MAATPVVADLGRMVHHGGASWDDPGFVYQPPAGAWGNQAERVATAAADRMNLSG